MQSGKDKVKRKSAVIFTWLFLAALFSVPVVQAVLELSRKERIQVLDIFHDTFIGSLENRKSVLQNFDNLKTNLVKGKENRDSEPEHVEEALAAAEEIKRRIENVNRYISDDSVSGAVEINSVINKLKQLVEADEEERTEEKLQDVINEVSGMEKNIRKRDFFAPIRHFFSYTVFNSRYLRKYEKEIEEKSFAAEIMRPAVRHLWYRITGDAGEKVVMGRDGWMFYKQDVDYLCMPAVTDKRFRTQVTKGKAVPDDPVRAVVFFRDQLKESGIDLLLVIVPGKPSIYPDMIHGDARPGSVSEISHSYKLLKRFQENGIATVDLFTPFIEERKNDSLYGEYLYLKKDTHWNTRALRTAAREVAARVREMPWYGENHTGMNYVLDSLYVMRKGDIGEMSGLKVSRSTVFEPERILCYQVYAANQSKDGSSEKKTLYRDDFRRSRIIILGDSFSRIYQTDQPRAAGWIAHLANELSEPLSSIVNDGGASAIVRQILSKRVSVLEGKKLVVWQIVERDFRFGDQGWPDVVLKPIKERENP